MPTTLSRCRPCTSPQAGQNCLTLLALLACAGFAFTTPLFPEPSRYAKGILALLTLIAFARGERSTQLFTPFLFFLIAVGLEVTSWVGSFQGAAFQFPPNQLPQVEGVGKWFWFILLAFWLQKKSWAPPVFWATAIVTIAITPWVTGNGLTEMELAMDGYRIDMGTMNAQHAAMYAGLMLLGGVCLLLHSGMASVRRGLLLSAGFLITILALFYLYATQTRAVWLGCIGAVTVILTLYALLKDWRMERKIKKRPMVLIITVLMITGIWAVIQTPMSSKIDQENGTISLVMEGRFSEMPLNSSGIRIRSWYYALPWIAQSPWLGWGPDGSKLIMQESDALPADLKKHFGHLHNTYFDLLAQYGLAGLIFYLSLLAWFMRRLVQAHRNRTIPPAAFIFGVGFLVYWLIVNTFESYMLFSSGKYAFSMVLAGTLSLMQTPKHAIGHISSPKRQIPTHV